MRPPVRYSGTSVETTIAAASISFSRCAAGSASLIYDGDGLLDLFVANYTTSTPAQDKRCRNPTDIESFCGPTNYSSVPNTLYRNLGGGRFDDVTMKSVWPALLGMEWGVSIADFNGGGSQDVLEVNDAERNLLFGLRRLSFTIFATGPAILVRDIVPSHLQRSH